ncbi:MAG: hypothetical protein ACRCUY_06030 [Thermoguttaceae bacterium]
MKTRSFILLAILPMLLTMSCNKAPDGMPKIYPCSVSVVNDSGPVEGAIIMLFPETEIGDIVSTGTTDKNGIAKIATMYQLYTQNGAPEGDYKITIQKEPFLAHTKTPEELVRMDRTELESYTKEYRAKFNVLPKIVPEKLTKHNSTPLKLSITPVGGRLDVDLSQYKK